MDELQHFQPGGLGSFLQRLSLLVREICWNRNDRRVYLLAEEIRRGGFQSAEMPRCYLGYRDCVLAISFAVSYGESNGAIVLFRMSGLVAWCWIDRFEAVKLKKSSLAIYAETISWRCSLLPEKVSEICNSILRIPHELRLCLCALELLPFNV
jgi:hypothetical protein